MDIVEIADIALDAFPSAYQSRMIAIAGAESGFDPLASGDRLDSFAPGTQPAYEPYAVNGYLSFGLWQIFLGVHHPRIQGLSGYTDGPDLVRWLQDPRNNAKAAATILADQGLGAWSTYNNAAWRDFEIEASAALSTAIEKANRQQRGSFVAVSFNGSTVHLDRADGTYEERRLTDAALYGDWIRFNLG